MRKLTNIERRSLAKQATVALLVGEKEKAAKGFSAAWTGYWEGGESSRYRNRPGTRLTAQDTDLDYGAREALSSEARVLSQTDPIVSNIKRKYANHCVGTCKIKWDTGDPEIDRIYADNWESRMHTLDAAGTHHFAKLTKIVCEEAIGIGDIFGQKIKLNGEGKIRMIEGDRVNNGSGSPMNVDSDNVIGGIGIDGYGRRVFARVWDRDRFGNFKNKRDIPWSEILHVYDPSRADAIRGVTAFAPVLNTTRDRKETKRAERLAAKANSKLAMLIKTKMGGATTGAPDLFSNDTPTQGGENKVNVQEINDVANAYMFPEEQIDAHKSERPSEGWRWLMEDDIREIALGLNLPFGVVWNMAGLGGPAARFEINQANRTFVNFIRDVLEPKWIVPIAGWVTSEDISRGKIPAHPRWFNFTPHRPISISIDLGRDSKAAIEENRAGLTSATSLFGEVDEDFETQTDRIVYEAKYRLAKCKGVPITEIKEIPVDHVRLLTPNGTPPPTEEENPEQPDMVNVEQIKAEFDAYGVGVRAGTITPNDEDENYFRKRLGLPPVNKNVKKAWTEDGGVRRPITLVGKDGVLGEQSKKPATQENEE